MRKKKFTFVKKVLLVKLFFAFSFVMQGQVIYVYSNADDGFLNIRMKPNASSDIVGVLYNGKEGAKLLDKSNKYWYKVSKNGIVGYVNKRYAKLTNETTPSDSRQESKPISGFEELQIGMTAEECRRLCGEPNKIDKQVYSNRVVELWTYKNPYFIIHFRNGVLDYYSFQENKSKQSTK